MLITLDQIYFVTLPLATLAETEVLIAARNTYGERFVEQVIKAARIQIHLRRAKKMRSRPVLTLPANHGRPCVRTTERSRIMPRWTWPGGTCRQSSGARHARNSFARDKAR